jgi:DNA-directed RNA polymerase subunit RPC12/RpoP
MSNWYYYDEKGEKIEVTGGQLKGLAREGLITPETLVETSDGKTGRAGKVKGLTFPEAPSTDVDSHSAVEPASPARSDPVAQTSVPIPPPIQVNVAKCQNCGASLPLIWGENVATCKYCRANNLITIGADGQIALSLVKRVDAIEGKTVQVEDKAVTALDLFNRQRLGLAVSTARTRANREAERVQYRQKIQNLLVKYESRMEELQKEKDTVGFNSSRLRAIQKEIDDLHQKIIEYREIIRQYSFGQ